MTTNPPPTDPMEAQLAQRRNSEAPPDGYLQADASLESLQPDPKQPTGENPESEEVGEPITPAARRVGWIRGLYYWVLSWAETRYGTPALAGISFTESSFFPIPPDVLQIALSVSKPRWSFYYAAVSSIASVAGGVLGWCIGYIVWQSVQGFFFGYVPGFSEENFNYVTGKYQDNALLAIIGAAFTPIPYKIFTIAAGAAMVPLWTLVLGSLIGRTARFMIVAAAIFFFGEKVKDLLENYFEIATLLLFILLVGGFLLLKVLL